MKVSSCDKELVIDREKLSDDQHYDLVKLIPLWKGRVVGDTWPKHEKNKQTKNKKKKTSLSCTDTSFRKYTSLKWFS